jgi:hypothetical protein
VPKLRDVAKVIRSKNAKPFVLTFDVVFETDETYGLAVSAPSFTAESIANLYGVAPETVVVIPYPAARAIKVTMQRWVPAGSFEDRDLHGAQQAVLLFDLELGQPA